MSMQHGLRRGSYSYTNQSRFPHARVDVTMAWATTVPAEPADDHDWSKLCLLFRNGEQVLILKSWTSAQRDFTILKPLHHGDGLGMMDVCPESQSALELEHAQDAALVPLQAKNA